MSEVVKKLITELGFKLTDKKILDDYKNVSKVISKGQKDQTKTLKSEVVKRNVIEKDNTKQLLKETDKLFKDFDKDQLKRKQNFQKNLNKDLDKIEKERAKKRQVFQKNLNKDLENIEKVTAQKRENRQKIYNALNDEHNKILKNRAVIERDSLKRNLENDIAKAQARQREYAQNQRNLSLERERVRLNQQQQERERTTRQYREGGHISRLDKELRRGVNERLKPQGKQMLSNGQIVDIPKEKRPFFDREATGQFITDKAQQAGQVAQNVILSSVDKMLNFEYLMNELKVRGELSNKEAKNIDKVVKEMSVKWGTDIMGTAQTAIGLAKSGIVGKPLAFITEEIVMLARSMGTTPEMAGEMLNAFLHQQGKNLQTKQAIKKGIGVTQDPQAVKKASNLLSAAVNASALDPKDLMYTLKYASSSASLAGVKPEDFLFESMRLANRFQKGSTSGTSQRRIFQTFSQQLNEMLVAEETGKRRGKKKSKTGFGYEFKDFGITKKDYYRDFGGTMRLDYINLMLDLQRAMKKKGFDQLKRLAVTGELTGLTASQTGVILGEDLTPEDKKMYKAINQANKRDETRRVATALSKTPKTTWDRVGSAKDVALTNVGKQFEKPANFIGGGLLRVLEGFNKDKGQQKAGSSLLGGMVGTGLVGAIGGGVGLLTGAGAMAGAIPALAFASGFVALHDAIALLNGDQTILGGLYTAMKQFFNVDAPIRSTASAITALSNSLSNATKDIQQFLGSYQTMEKLGIVNVGVNVTTTGNSNVVPYAPGKAPTQRNKPTYYFMNNATANRKG